MVFYIKTRDHKILELTDSGIVLRRVHVNKKLR